MIKRYVVGQNTSTKRSKESEIKRLQSILDQADKDGWPNPLGRKGYQDTQAKIEQLQAQVKSE